MSDQQVPPPPGDAPPPVPPPPSAPPPPSGPPPAGGGGTVSDNRNIMIVLAYLGPLALIPLLVEKNDNEVQWHAKHGLVLLGAEIVLWVALTILNIVLSMIFPPIGCLLTLVYLALALGIMVFHIMCIVKGVGGERLTVPAISEFADKF